MRRIANTGEPQSTLSKLIELVEQGEEGSSPARIATAMQLRALDQKGGAAGIEHVDALPGAPSLDRSAAE